MKHYLKTRSINRQLKNWKPVDFDEIAAVLRYD